MIRFYLTCFSVILLLPAIQAQVGICSVDSNYYLNAIIDLQSTTRGLLIPRMTLAQRDIIQTPAEGLMVYCTNCSPDGRGIISIYLDNHWQYPKEHCQKPGTPLSGTHEALGHQITWNWQTVSNADGYKWNTTRNYETAINCYDYPGHTQTGLECGTDYRCFVWAYDDCGHSAYRICTQSTPDYPEAPVSGVHTSGTGQITWTWHPVPGAWEYRWAQLNNYETYIYQGQDTSFTESGLECDSLYTRYIWAMNDCGHSALTAISQSISGTQMTFSLIAGSHTADTMQITWSWSAMSGASGYKWNTVNNFESALDLEESTSHTETGLTCGTNYTRYAWAYGPCWYSQPATLTQSTLECQGGGGCEAFTDSRDGQYYPAVQIGTQCWLAKNMNVGVMLYAEEEGWNNSIIEKHCYNDQSSNCTIYGGLYSREEMLQFVFDDNQGVCPSGWHIPSVSEWNTLITYLGGSSVAGGKMKQTGTLHWQIPNTGATNESGFTGLPGGQFAFWSYSDLHSTGYFWALEECEMPPGIFYILAYFTDDIEQMCGSPMESGEFSVRCLKNEEP
jgi:uncharacterized protein (TIGR02145 family)